MINQITGYSRHLLDIVPLGAINELAVDVEPSGEGRLALEDGGVKLVGESLRHCEFGKVECV